MKISHPQITLSVLIVDAIVGVGIPTFGLGLECEKAGMAVYLGDGTYSWIPHRLKALSEKQLQELYVALKEAQIEALDELKQPAPEPKSSIIIGGH